MFLIDTDPGLDDIHAIAMAIRHLPAAEIVVTTVAGNVGIDIVTTNARWLLGALGPDIPVYAGARGPLLGQKVEAGHIHGDNGLAGAPRTPDVEAPLQPEHAVSAIIGLAKRWGSELTIVALGPLTNLALALQLEPEIAHLIGGVVAMGGSPAGFGNASINAEYNVFADPVAAEIVFSRMPNITLVTWDLCLENRFSGEELAGFWASESPAATLLRSVHGYRVATDPDFASSPDFGRADPLAMAVALDRACVMSAAHHPVVVGYGGGLDHGATVVDWRDSLADRPAVQIIQELDRDRILDLLTV
jgi:purine nucleosidase